MAGTTAHYALHKMGGGELFSDNGYQHVWRDRDLIDLLLWLGAEAHHHTGATAVDETPAIGPNLQLDASGGLIPAGTRVFYKVTYVNQATGIETAASPEVYVNTPAPVAEPLAPSLTEMTAGTHTAGVYFYSLSAYVGTTTEETKALASASIAVSGADNRIRVAFPTLPSGADGFNIYRRGPGDVTHKFLTSVAVAGATPATYYDDDGSVALDCNRGLPTVNATNADNEITISLPGATPAAPVGYDWRIYRTMVSGDWSNSLLDEVDEATTSYVDTGLATSTGSPPIATLLVGSPPKVDLEDAAEVQGRLPMGLNSYPIVVTFAFPDDPLEAREGEAVWTCEFPEATIIASRVTLGPGSAPAAENVIGDVHKGTGATPTFTTIYTTQANRPKVLVGQQRGDRTQPDVRTLVEGDMLRADMDVIGGGATPTDRMATLNVYMIAHGFDEDTSFVDGTTTGI